MARQVPPWKCDECQQLAHIYNLGAYMCNSCYWEFLKKPTKPMTHKQIIAKQKEIDEWYKRVK